MSMLPQIVFWLLSVTALTSAVLVITRRNAVHSVIWLIVTLVAVGGIFLTQHAQFLFAVQIILYVGGIMVLFLFVVMLINLDVSVKQAQFNRQWRLAVFAGLVLLAGLVYVLSKGGNALALAPASVAPPVQGHTQRVGSSLYQDYMLAVEIASLLLLVAMVGAVIMAKRKFE